MLSGVNRLAGEDVATRGYGDCSLQRFLPRQIGGHKVAGWQGSRRRGVT